MTSSDYCRNLNFFLDAHDLPLGEQMIRLPRVARGRALIADALMQPERPVAPEFDRQGLHAKARPMRRAPHGLEGIFFPVTCHFLFQGEASFQGPRLPRPPSA